MKRYQKAALVRRLMWIAFCWNDHNFEQTPQQVARDELEKVGISSLDDANTAIDLLARGMTVEGQTEPRHIDAVTLAELRAAADQLMRHGKVGAYSLLKPILEHFE